MGLFNKLGAVKRVISGAYRQIDSPEKARNATTADLIRRLNAVTAQILNAEQFQSRSAKAQAALPSLVREREVICAEGGRRAGSDPETIAIVMQAAPPELVQQFELIENRGEEIDWRMVMDDFLPKDSRS